MGKYTELVPAPLCSVGGKPRLGSGRDTGRSSLALARRIVCTTRWWIVGTVGSPDMKTTVSVEMILFLQLLRTFH